MGIVLSAFITTTCSKLLLWFVLLLMPRLRPKPIQLFSMELTAMLVMLPHTHTAMPDIHMPTPTLPEDTPLPEDTSPTLPELSMLPRERLRLKLMLMLTTVTTERDLLMLSQRPRLMLLSSTEPTDMLVSHTLDMPMVLTHMPTELTHMPTELTTERDLLMLSQRPMPTTDTTDMPDHTPTDMPHTLMELTHTVMDMPGESKLFQPKVLSYCKPKAQ